MAIWKCLLCGRCFVREEPHETLGLPKDAPMEEIKKRYREIVKTTHPDALRSDHAVEKFRKATDAYQELKKDRAGGRATVSKIEMPRVEIYQRGRPCPGCGKT
jgi:DnaJ-class molecular chaperone